MFIVEKNGHWYAVFECEREVEPSKKTGRIVGIDAGVHVLAASSEGHLIPNARPNTRHRRVVTRLQRELDAATHKDAAGRCLNRKDPQRKKAALALGACQGARSQPALGSRAQIRQEDRRTRRSVGFGEVEHPSHDPFRQGNGRASRSQRAGKVGVEPGDLGCGMGSAQETDSRKGGRSCSSDHLGRRKVFIAEVLDVVCTSVPRAVGKGAFVALRVAGVAMRM